MRHGHILNAELSYAISMMGHGDIMIVCDSGFPIPNDAWRIDLALIQDVPDIETVLKAISQEFIAEKVAYAAEMAENNPVLLEKVKRNFPDSEHFTLPHEKILTEMAKKAKAIVRTGAFDPWGNILLYSGVDVRKWFAKPGTKVPDYYARRMKQR